MPPKSSRKSSSPRKGQSPAGSPNLNRKNSPESKPSPPTQQRIYPDISAEHDELRRRTRSGGKEQPNYREHSSSEEEGFDSGDNSTLNETNLQEGLDDFDVDVNRKSKDHSFDAESPSKLVSPGKFGYTPGNVIEKPAPRRPLPGVGGDAKNQKKSQKEQKPARQHHQHDELSDNRVRQRPIGDNRAAVDDKHLTRDEAYLAYSRAGYHDNQDNDNGSSLVNYVIICLVVLLVGAFAFKFISTETKNDIPMTRSGDIPQRDRMVGSFVESLKKIKESFPGQSPRCWATLAATTKAVLKTEEPQQPGIILLAGTSTTMKTIHCLEKRLSDAATSSYEDARRPVRLTIDQDHLAMPHADLKLLIDDEFKAGLGSGSRVAVLRNIHDVPGKAAMMFHAYCDNESAPFKDNVIIFTFTLNMTAKKFGESDDVEVARAVEDQLQKKWEREIGIDNTMALLSRVANNIAVVRCESDTVLRRENCM